jgi:transposase
VAKAYRRFSAEFKLRLGESYLAGNGSLKGLAFQAGIEHSLLHYWVKRYHAGELTLDIVREEAITEAESKIAALVRKVGQLTMERELLNRGAHRLGGHLKSGH